MMGQMTFCAIILVALLCLCMADKKSSKLFLWIGIAILTLAAGLRNENVGVDTHAYIYSLNNNFPVSWQFTEAGFRALSNVLMAVFKHNATWVLVVYAFVTNALILIRLWDFRTKCSYSYMVFLYLTINYINTMNIMRQFVSIAIVFFATRFLEKRRYLIFIIFLIFATSIHSTALLGVVFLVVYFWENASPKQKRWLWIPIAIIIPVAVYYILNYESGHIANYFSQYTSNLNITYIYRVGAFLLAMMLQMIEKQIVFKRNERKESMLIPVKWTDKETVFYIIGLGTSSFGMFFSFLSRLGMYYLMYEMVFWGRVVKEGKSRQITLALSLIYAIYVFGMELIYNGSKIFPYGIHWF